MIQAVHPDVWDSFVSLRENGGAAGKVTDSASLDF